MRRRLGSLAFAGVLIVTAPASALAAPQPPLPDVTGLAHKDYAEVSGRLRGAGTQHSVSHVSNDAPRLVRRYAPACTGNGPAGRPSLDVLCAPAADACPEEQILFWVFVAPAGPPAPSADDFVYANQTVCRGIDEVPADAVPVFGVEDFRRLPLPAGTVHIQPPNGRTLVNVPTNVYVDAEVVTLPTELLGFPVRVRATPARFNWKFGDGRTLSTRDSGAPYPGMTTTHTYTRPQTARVSLTTVYAGEYSVAGGPFQPIDGTAAVTSPASALAVLAAENQLITGD